MKILKELYAKINFADFILPEGQNITYGAKNLLWLDLILSISGKNSYRDKSFYLQSLGLVKFNQFCKDIGITKNFQKIPSKSIFFDYKKRIDFDKFQEFTNQYFTQSFIDEIKDCFEQLMDNQLHQKDLKQSYLNYKIDGKSIKNTQIHTVNNCINELIIMNHYVEKNNLFTVESYFTTHEQTYIKDNLIEDLNLVTHRLRKITNKFIHHKILLTADAAYFKQKLIQQFITKEINFLLPIKNKGKDIIDLTIFEKDRKNYYEKTYTHMYNQTIITDIVRLIPINHAQYRYVLEINRESEHKQTQKINKKVLTFFTNIEELFSQKLLEFLYHIKLKHWSIESFHKIKDVLFKEDRYHKSIEGAKYQAMKINFMACILQKVNLTVNKYNLDNFLNHIFLCLLFIKSNWTVL